jgi:hypothetical protein
MYKRIEISIKGVAPLITHNGQLADPMNEWTKAIAAISSKGKAMTDADRIEMGRLEFFGGLYLHEGAPCIPGVNIESLILAGAKKSKMGPQFKAGLICDGYFPLEYAGPKDPTKMWECGRFKHYCRVKLNGKSTVNRTRPIFHEWALKFVVQYLDSVIKSRDSVVKAIGEAGMIVGLGDYKPRFGRFEVVESKLMD